MKVCCNVFLLTLPTSPNSQALVIEPELSFVPANTPSCIGIDREEPATSDDDRLRKRQRSRQHHGHLCGYPAHVPPYHPAADNLYEFPPIHFFSEFLHSSQSGFFISLFTCQCM